MLDGSIVIVRGEELRGLLAGHEQEVLDGVRNAYEMHARGHTSLPHSTFLRFPDRPQNRIIALPAYLGDGMQVAGIKWISSVPANIHRGMERASAVVILNDAETGQPTALLEGSSISAARTAASAALAAQVLCEGRDIPRIGLVGTGRISVDILRFLRVVRPEVAEYQVFDLDAARARAFCARASAEHPGVAFGVAAGIPEMLAACPLVSFATTAAEPHVHDLSMCPPGATILHVSLRDLSADVILAADNVVDDLDHVCRAATSIHLAEQATGRRDFVRCSLGEILTGDAPARTDPDSVTVFSPFGLGILDLALAQWAVDARGGAGVVVEGFLPEPVGA